MPAIFDTTDDGLKRVTGILPANTQYVTTMFWVYFNAWPTSGQTRTFYMVSNSASRDTESIAIIQDDTGSIKLKVGTTLYGGGIFKPGWHSVGLRRRPTSNFLDMDVDNDSTPVSTATITFDTWTFDEVYLGTDPRIPTGGVSHQVAYFREWAAFLGYTSEWVSVTPVQTTGLDTDTPLKDDLLDDTANDHDWTAVGTQTFTGGPTSNVGSMGGWWFHALIPITSPECLIRAQLADSAGSTSARLIAEIRVNALSSTSVGDIVTASSWEVKLRYGSGSGSTDITELTSTDPFPDPVVGQSISSPAARNSWAVRVRWALSWKCSTYDSTTSTYAADGYAKLYMNGSLLLSAVDVTIPRKIDGLGIQYSISPMTDTDRHWARTVVDVPATDSEGAFTSGTPSDLVYFEDFNGGLYPNWTVTELWPSGGGSFGTPNAYSNCGGDDGYGISTWAMPPNATSGSGTYLPYSGLTRFEKFPPLPLTTGEDPEDPPPPDEPIPGDPSGIYYTNPPTPGIPGLTHDTYIDRTVTPSSTIERKIPDPTIRTALFGE